MLERYRTVAEVARVIGVSPSAIRVWERDGLIPKTNRYGVQRRRLYTPGQIEVIKQFAIQRGQPDLRGK